MGMRLISGGVTLKGLIIGVIALLLMIPLAMLRSVVSERSSLREQAYARVAEGWGGDVVLGGPMLIVPTERMVEEDHTRRLVRRDVYVLPAALGMNANLGVEPEPRRVGIYSVPVYLSRVQLTGRFDLAALRSQASRSDAVYLWGESRLLLPLSRVRSLREASIINFAGQNLKLGPARAGGVYRGVEAPLDLSRLTSSDAAPFDFDVLIAGSREFGMLPLGSITTIQLKSNWPHPSFQGAFLPAQRAISSSGFDARWQVLELNRPYAQMWTEGEVSESMLSESQFGVGLHQTVDVYQRGERAVKYALLFIALTFLALFAWEQVAQVRLHPLQYLLVGVALSLFYLLLIALSEHIAFASAYALAATGLVALIGAYIAGALGSGLRGFIAGSTLSAVYALLYMLVLSEDYALLLGAIVLFGVLTAVMLLTRKVDWYAQSH
ncbi:MAG TPA: cell envelope integrity protein CreD [Steroidobacter sp.]|jgi:inner membrane protein|nr:cell envelope integrity protein CreD [Steroidobacter sp.]